MNNKNKCTFFGFESYSLQKTEKPINGRNPKKISTKIVNMSLSPLTTLPLKAIVNKKIVNYGADFNPPTYCRDREL